MLKVINPTWDVAHLFDHLLFEGKVAVVICLLTAAHKGGILLLDSLGSGASGMQSIVQNHYGSCGKNTFRKRLLLRTLFLLPALVLI